MSKKASKLLQKFTQLVQHSTEATLILQWVPGSAD
jgi:hypothetical protein